MICCACWEIRQILQKCSYFMVGKAMPQGKIVSSLGLVVAIYAALQDYTAEKVLDAVEAQTHGKADLKSGPATGTNIFQEPAWQTSQDSY